MHSTAVVDVTRLKHRGSVVHIPGKLRLPEGMGILHRADGTLRARPLAHKPCPLGSIFDEHLHEVAHNVAHALVDGTAVVHVHVGRHRRARNAVRKLMRNDVGILAVGIHAVERKHLEAILLAQIGGLVRLLTVLVDVVHKEQGRRTLRIRTRPPNAIEEVPHPHEGVVCEQVHVVERVVLRRAGNQLVVVRVFGVVGTQNLALGIRQDDAV